MERFRPDGHLTDDALTALVQTQELGQLGRLEIAEHLSYCNLCLQRYTEALTCIPLLTPDQSCQTSIWRRIRSRAIRMITSRYATAAAAVALALTLLWSDTSFAGRLQARWDQENRAPEAHQAFQILPEEWTRSLNGLLTGFQGLFDPPQGGNHS